MINGNEIAMKIIPFYVSRDAMNEEQVKSVQMAYKQIQIFQQLEHPGIARYYFMDKNDSSVRISMEIMKECLLEIWLKTKDLLRRKSSVNTASRFCIDFV